MASTLTAPPARLIAPSVTVSLSSVPERSTTIEPLSSCPTTVSFAPATSTRRYSAGSVVSVVSVTVPVSATFGTLSVSVALTEPLMPAALMVKVAVPCWVTVSVVPPKRATTFVAVIVVTPAALVTLKSPPSSWPRIVSLRFVPATRKNLPIGSTSFTGAPASSIVSSTTAVVVLTWTRSVPLSATFGTVRAIVPPKSPARPADLTSSVPEALRHGQHAAAEREVHVGEREADDLAVGVGRGAARDAVGAEGGDRLEREVAGQLLAEQRELDAGAGDPHVRAADQVQRDALPRDRQRLVDRGVAGVDRQRERAGEDRVAREREADRALQRAREAGAGDQQRAAPLVSEAPAPGVPIE